MLRFSRGWRGISLVVIYGSSIKRSFWRNCDMFIGVYRSVCVNQLPIVLLVPIGL
jgi:hypothetical protein